MNVFGETQSSEAITGDTGNEGRRALGGDISEQGYRVEWHDFSTQSDVDWSRRFHPDSLGICLNVAGRASVQSGRASLELRPSTAGYYFQAGSKLTALRRGGDRHQFVTIEFSLAYLQRQALFGESGMDPRLNRVLRNTPREQASVSEPTRLTSEQQQMVMNFRRPPVYAAAQKLWYQAKALEVAATLLYRPLPGEELFCERYKRLSQERVEKVAAILKKDLAEPPSLKQIAREVGCSQFHLSRLFTREMGKSISCHLRDLRMERAAELLKAGRLNVTETACAVGYSSLSHFTVAFRETFDCCPGLYPLYPAGGKTK